VGTAGAGYPKCFARGAAGRAAKLSQAKFEAAMNRLFAAGTIRIETYGRANRPDRRIVRAVWPRSNKV